ncbi:MULTISPECIES: hypothetical protein [unclassified Streptomyces]|uniref:hypothetical protein n=1 Tax=unclassified Streptomyces TaxID=2593676 RepID=UPI0033E79653
MHRRSTPLYGVLLALLGLTLTACGGDAESGNPGISEGRPVKGGSSQESPSASASPKGEWGPALAMGQPSPKLYQPANTGGGTFEVAAKKIVRGTREQAKSLHWDTVAPGELMGDTPYFVYFTYTLKAGKPQSPNADLGAHAAALDKNGVKVADRPTVHTGYVDGGCEVPPVYMGWDVGETHTLCTVFAGNASNPPKRLVWTTALSTDKDYMKAASWEWTTR